MSVLIKGMEMPTSCQNCFASDDGSRFCKAAKEYIPMLGKPKFCPLVPVPPHGRLIDADALMGVIRAHDYPLRAHFNSTDNGMFTIGIQQAVDEAPTIIPASGEGEG